MRCGTCGERLDLYTVGHICGTALYPMPEPVAEPSLADKFQALTERVAALEANAAARAEFAREDRIDRAFGS